MTLDGKTIAVLGTAAHGDRALEALRSGLCREGAEVYVIGPSEGEAETADMRPGEASETWFDALVIPNGPYVSRFVADEAALEFVTQFEIDAKPMAAVCRGVLVLVAAELVAGRRIATEAAIREQVEEEGGRVSDEPLVEDEMWITAQSDDCLEDLLGRLVASVRRIHLAARDASGPLNS